MVMMLTKMMMRMAIMTMEKINMFAPVFVCPAPFVHDERAMRENFDGTSCEPLKRREEWRRANFDGKPHGTAVRHTY